jgi:hypothetical protein
MEKPMNQPATTSGPERADMERHDAVRVAGDLLWRRDLRELDRETVRTHVVCLLVDSVIKQERWSR